MSSDEDCSLLHVRMEPIDPEQADNADNPTEQPVSATASSSSSTTYSGSSDSGSDVDNEVGAVDVAARLYMHLRAGDREAAMSLIQSCSTPEALAAPSAWREKRKEHGSDGQEFYLQNGQRHTQSGHEVNQYTASNATRGMTALHVAARDCGSDVELLSEVIRRSGPGALLRPDSDGRLPAHYLGAENPNVAALQVIIADGTGDAQAMTADGEGQTPVQLAALLQPDTAVAAGFLEIAFRLHKELPLRLVLALREGDDAAAMEQIDRAQGREFLEVSTWTAKHWVQLEGKRRFVGSDKIMDDDGDYIDEDDADFAALGLTALHILARDCHDEEVIAKVLANPEGKKTVHFAGGQSQYEQPLCRIPLHYAALNPNIAVAQCLLQYDGGQQAVAMDCTGSLPLDLATRHDTDAQGILAAAMPPDLGKPLYLALLRDDHAAAMQLLLNQESAALLAASRWPNRRYQAPESGDKDNETERHFLMDGQLVGQDGNPVEEEHADCAAQGLNVLHILARDSRDQTLLKTAVEICGAASLLCTSKTSASEPVRRWGGFGRQRKKGKGRLPLHYAAAENPSTSVMQVLLDLGGSQQLEIQDDDNKTALY